MALVHLAVRVVHVLGMALLLGGAAFAWGCLRWRPGGGDGDALAVAAGYEWLFWGAAGAMVATGVGNLGALAPGVPGPDTYWGAVLAAKLAAVVGLLVGSIARTFLVTQARTRACDVHPVPVAGILRRSYAATAVYLAGVVVLAEVLAHG